MQIKEKKLERGVYRSDRFYKDERIESWIVRFEYYDYEGIRRKIQPRVATEKLAKKKEKDLIADEAAGRGIFAPPPPEPIPEPEKPKVWTFREFADIYLDNVKPTWAESSRPNRISETHGLVEYFGDTLIKDIDFEAVMKFKSYMQNKPVRVEVKVKSSEQIYNPMTKRKAFARSKETRETPRSSSSVNHYLVRLGALLRYAAKKYKICDLPVFSGVVQASEDNARDIAISFAEFEKLQSVCSDELRLLLVGLFESGARLCELEALRREDISFEHKTARVLNSKRSPDKPKTYRIAYFSEYLREALRAAGVEGMKPSDFVFTQTDMRSQYDTARKRIGMEEVTRKDLRHSLPTHLGMCGVDEMIIEKQIGHNQTNSLLRKVYVNFQADYLVAEMQKYERFSREQRENLMLGAEVLI